MPKFTFPAAPASFPGGGYPCWREWTPRTCRSTATDPAARLRSPIDHRCMEPRAVPHICRCGRCGHPTPRRLTSVASVEINGTDLTPYLTPARQEITTYGSRERVFLNPDGTIERESFGDE